MSKDGLLTINDATITAGVAWTIAQFQSDNNSLIAQYGTLLSDAAFLCNLIDDDYFENTGFTKAAFALELMGLRDYLKGIKK